MGAARWVQRNDRFSIIVPPDEELIIDPMQVHVVSTAIVNAGTLVTLEAHRDFYYEDRHFFRSSHEDVRTYESYVAGVKEFIEYRNAVAERLDEQ